MIRKASIEDPLNFVKINLMHLWMELLIFFIALLFCYQTFIDYLIWHSSLKDFIVDTGTVFVYIASLTLIHYSVL